MAKINIVRIPYRDAGLALLGLISGQVQLMLATAGSAALHVRQGKLRALAITSAQPSALLRGLPTVAASGLPGHEANAPFGI